MPKRLPLAVHGCALVVALMLSVDRPVLAQEASSGGGRTAGVERAAEQVEAGDLAAAIATLEASTPDPQVDAMLGALYVESGRSAEAFERLAPLAASPSADAAVLYNAGRAAVALSRFDEAEALLNRSVALAPGSPAARELGRLLCAFGYCDQAYVYLLPWARSHPGDAEGRLMAANCALELGRGPEAEELLSGIGQDDDRVKLLWGQMLLLKGDAWGALSMLQPLAEALPPNLELRLRRLMAEAYVVVGQASPAIELLEGRVAEDPSLSLLLSNAHYLGGDLDRAISVIEPFALQFIQPDADTPFEESVVVSVALEYGRLLVIAGRNGEALPPLELVMRLSPETPQVWQTVSQALEATGHPEQAERARQRFQALTAAGSQGTQDVESRDPTLREIRRGFSLVSEGAADEALLIAQQERQLAPGDFRPLLLESLALLNLGRAREALESAERAIALAPDNADAHYQRGIVAVSLGDIEAAEADLRQAIAIAPQHTAAMSDLALLLLSKGSRDEAVVLLERVLELRPTDPVVAANLQRVRAASGEGS